MENRFARLYSLTENLYRTGAPVVISAGALLKDNQNGNMIAQIKFKNISSKTIKALTVGVIPYDTVGRELDEVKIHQFLDLNARRDDTFGDQTPILLKDQTVRSYGVYVAEVAFSDNTLWTGEQNPWAEGIVPKPLSEVLKEDSLQEQYAIALDMPLAKYAPTEVADLWICACGAINRKGENACHTCDRTFQHLQNELNIDKLTHARDQRLAEIKAKEEAERAERERQAEIAKQKRAETAKKTKKKLKIVVPVACVIAVIYLIAVNIVIPNGKYNDAVALMEAGQYQGALPLLGQVNDYKDSRQLIREILNDKTIISGGNSHTAGLKSDGTVVAVGDNDYGQCNVDGWTDIVAVSTGDSHTVGLKSDGTVVAVGNNWDGQCEVDDWTDIVAVSAGDSHTVGLKSDGTVVAVGDNNNGQCEVAGWTDIVAVSAGNPYTAGLKSDGTVVAVGSNWYGQCEVDDWKDVTTVFAGGWHTIGLKSDGTVIAVGNNRNGECNVATWVDIVAVSAGYSHTIGLKSDGTVVATGENWYGQCEVDGWTDIVAVSAGDRHTVGLKSDGTVVVVGNNWADQCDVDGWDLW